MQVSSSSSVTFDYGTISALATVPVGKGQAFYDAVDKAAAELTGGKISADEFERVRAPALESYRPSNNRSQIIPYGSNTVLLDAYNANPSSMEPALKSLQAMSAKYKIAVLGDMLELGENSEKEHAAILRLAAKMGLDQIVLVGKEFGKTPYQRYGALHFPDNTAAKAWLDAQQLEHALILVKGSRGVRLELVVSPKS